MTPLESTDSATPLGFWIYLMTDLVLFASLFAVYAVLQANTAGGPGGLQLFRGPFVLGETLILLTSSLTAGLGALALRSGRRRPVMSYFTLTIALGITFLLLELSEFRNLAAAGNDWTRSGFLSAFFTLVGTHGLHIAIGLIWITAQLIVMVRRGLTPVTARRLQLAALFWHFLDLVWIFIFTVVYLMGMVQ